MNRLLTTLLLVALLATGCNYLPASREGLTEEVNGWLSEENYGKALDALLFINPSNPEYQQYGALKEQVLKKAGDYEKSVILQANDEEQHDRWESGKAILKNGLNHYPQSEKLRHAQEQFNKRRIEKQKRIDLEIMISRGEWLVDELRLRDARRMVSPNQLIENWHIQGLNSEARTLSDKLCGEGIAALDAGNLDLAKRTLPLANRLHGSQKNRQAIQQLEKRLAVLNRIKQHDQGLKQDREKDSLLIYFDQALKNGDLQQASALLVQLEQLDPDNAELATRKQLLDERIAMVVQMLLQEGNNYYSQSKYEIAIRSWEIAKSLAPDNQQLYVQIERAKRILSNLQELQEKNQ
jgi:hypothetical protein